MSRWLRWAPFVLAAGIGLYELTWLRQSDMAWLMVGLSACVALLELPSR